MIRITESMATEIVQRYRYGESGSRLARAYNCSTHAIYNTLSAQGCEIRTLWRTGKRTHTCDDHHFDDIDSPEKAYWLGFLGADGCIKANKRDLHTNLQLSDMSHLEILRQDLKASSPVRVHHEQKLNREYASLLVISEALCQGLMKHGVVPRKSMTLQPPDQLRGDMVPHYIRGYFDGNGCIHGHGRHISWSVVGSKELMTWIAASISSACGFLVAPPRPFQKQWTFEMKGAGKLTTLRGYLYPDLDGLRMLSRKWERFQEVQVRSEKRVAAWRRQQGSVV